MARRLGGYTGTRCLESALVAAYSHRMGVVVSQKGG